MVEDADGRKVGELKTVGFLGQHWQLDVVDPFPVPIVALAFMAAINGRADTPGDD